MPALQHMHVERYRFQEHAGPHVDAPSDTIGDVCIQRKRPFRHAIGNDGVRVMRAHIFDGGVHHRIRQMLEHFAHDDKIGLRQIVGRRVEMQELDVAGAAPARVIVGNDVSRHVDTDVDDRSLKAVENALATRKSPQPMSVTVRISGERLRNATTKSS